MSQPVFAFGLSFEWGDLRLCTSGNPNRVKNPPFVLEGVPAGTSKIQFKLVDLDVPSYNHGGGVVPWDGQETIEPGAFRYKSPCPPNGPHTYQWTAIAINDTGEALAVAKARRQYPE
ncbi:MAG TPA: phospholipid-binding protein [Devosia sp.]|nr:phospholipid-binding protein [Devosia sp.]